MGHLYLFTSNGLERVASVGAVDPSLDESVRRTLDDMAHGSLKFDVTATLTGDGDLQLPTFPSCLDGVGNPYYVLPLIGRGEQQGVWVGAAALSGGFSNVSASASTEQLMEAIAECLWRTGDIGPTGTRAPTGKDW